MRARQARYLKILGIGIVGFTLLWCLLAAWVHADLGDFCPDCETSTTMYVLKRRTLHYAHANNRLPKTVQELPTLENFINWDKDAWGLPIMFVVSGTEVTLISYGQDGLPGGTGNDRDMVNVFDAKTPMGAWADENDDSVYSWKTIDGVPPPVKASRSDPGV